MTHIEDFAAMTQRALAAKEAYKGIKPAPGQVWLIKTPTPLLDTVTEMEVCPAIFLLERSCTEVYNGEPSWYGLLCLGVSATHPLPVLQWNDIRIEHTLPYTAQLDLIPVGPVSPHAEFILHEFPTHVKEEWLVNAVADFGLEGSVEMHRRIFSFREKDIPEFVLDHPRNQIGGHTALDVVQHIVAHAFPE